MVLGKQENEHPLVSLRLRKAVWANPITKTKLVEITLYTGLMEDLLAARRAA